MTEYDSHDGDKKLIEVFLSFESPSCTVLADRFAFSSQRHSILLFLSCTGTVDAIDRLNKMLTKEREWIYPKDRAAPPVEADEIRINGLTVLIGSDAHLVAREVALPDGTRVPDLVRKASYDTRLEDLPDGLVHLEARYDQPEWTSTSSPTDMVMNRIELNKYSNPASLEDVTERLISCGAIIPSVAHNMNAWNFAERGAWIVSALPKPHLPYICHRLLGCAYSKETFDKFLAVPFQQNLADKRRPQQRQPTVATLSDKRTSNGNANKDKREMNAFSWIFIAIVAAVIYWLVTSSGSRPQSGGYRDTDTPGDRYEEKFPH